MSTRKADGSHEDGDGTTPAAETAGSERESDAPTGTMAQLLRAARNEAPHEQLEPRILEEIQYRTRLVGDTVPPPAETRSNPLVGPVGAGLVGATVLAAAAALLLWLRASSPQGTVELGAEPVQSETSPALEQSVGASRSAAAKPRQPPPDPCVRAVVAEGGAPQIDDFEDGDDIIERFEGRVGPWRWVRDTDAPGTAPALLPVPRVPAMDGTDNKLALHVKGGRLREWGATVEFVFEPKCYDASVYGGIAFEARGSGRVYLAPREVRVIPVASGGMCVEDCHNAHTAKIELDEKWRNYEVRFDEVEQRGYDQPPLNPKRLHSLAFLIRPEDTPYDVWLDDVRFVER